MAIDDYLEALPQVDVVQTIILSLTSKLKSMRLETVMAKVAESVLRVKKDGVLIENSFIQAVTTPRQSEKGPRRQGGPRGDQKRKHICPLCGFKTFHQEVDCIARDKQCKTCHKVGHFAKMCPNKSAVARSPEYLNCIVTTASETAHGENAPLLDSDSETLCCVVENPVCSKIVQEEAEFEKHFYIDTCASVSVLKDAECFSSITDHAVSSLSLADGKGINYKFRGVATVGFWTENDTFFEMEINAVYSPDVNMNLLSAFDLIKLGCVIELTSEPLLRVKDHRIPLTWATNRILRGDNDSMSSIAVIASIDEKLIDYELLHEEWGHPSKAVMKAMFGLDEPHNFECHECQIIRRRNNRPKLSDKTIEEREVLKPLEIYHADVLQVKSFKVLVLIDEKSRFVWTKLIDGVDTDTFIPAFTDLFIRAQRYPKKLVLDRQAAWTSQKFRKWALSIGIFLTYVSPKMHAQNGLAERVIMTLKKKTQVLLQMARLPHDKFFPWAMRHAVTLYNRTYHSSLKEAPIKLLNHRWKRQDRRFPKFGSTVFYEDKKKTLSGIYIGECEESLEHTVRIYGVSGQIIRRNASTCRYDETYLSRRKMPELFNIFLKRNKDDPDNDWILASLTPFGSSPPKNVTVIDPDTVVCPETFKQIEGGPQESKWIESMSAEVDKVMNKTLRIVSLDEVPDKKDLVPTRFVYAIKRSGAYKSRLVAQGHRQQWDILQDNSSPTADIVTLRLLLQLTVQNNWTLKSVDFEAAYLNAKLPVKLYATAPPGFEACRPDFDRSKSCFLVERCLYGLRASGSLWYTHLSNYLKSIGFVKGTFDSCLFKHASRSVVILGYVDDLLIAGVSEDIEWVISTFRKEYQIKEADLEDFLSFRIKKVENGLTLDCSDYAKAALAELGLTHCNPAKTPLPMKTVLKPAIADSDILAPDYHYNRYLGKLLWIAKTRPDLCFATNILARVAHRPTIEAWNCMKRVYRYLSGTLDLKLVFKPTTTTKLIAFSDSSFAEDHSYRSHGGCYIYIAGGMVQHYSRIQRNVATSTAESELVELFRTTNEVRFIQGLAEDMGMTILSSTIYTDALTVLNMIRSQNLLRRSKHMATKIVKLKEVEADGVLKFGKVHTAQNLADLTTKQLTFDRHAQAVKALYEFTCDTMLSRRPDRIPNKGLFQVPKATAPPATQSPWRVRKPPVTHRNKTLYSQKTRKMSNGARHNRKTVEFVY